MQKCVHHVLGMIIEPAFHFQSMLIRIIFLGRKVERMAHLAASLENLAWKLFFGFKARKVLCISYNLKGRSVKSFDT